MKELKDFQQHVLEDFVKTEKSHFEDISGGFGGCQLRLEDLSPNFLG